MSSLLHRKNLKECCRTCLNDLSTKMHGLFDEKNDSPNVAEILSLITNILVSMYLVLASEDIIYHTVNLSHTKVHQ